MIPHPEPNRQSHGTKAHNQPVTNNCVGSEPPPGRHRGLEHIGSEFGGPGDHFAVPQLQFAASAQYDFNVLDKDVYLRADYQFQGGYTNPGSYGVAVYNPFTRDFGSLDTVNLRAGVTCKIWDLNLYSNNISNKFERLGNAGNGVSGCAASPSAFASPACTSFSVYSPFVTQAFQRPREIGVQANYRF